MEHKILYSFSEEQLEKVFEKLFKKLNKTSLQSRPQKNIPEGEDRLNQQQVAKMLNRSVQTLIKWKKKKKIPFYQIGGTIFYSKSELLELSQKNPEIFNRL